MALRETTRPDEQAIDQVQEKVRRRLLCVFVRR
jgi:hypothetical protein